MALLKSKLNFVFDTFFDVNKDGSIQKSDFDLAINKSCSARGYSPATPKFKETSDSFLKVWEGLQKQADTDGDGEVSRDEWVGLWTNGGLSNEWKNLYMDFMFKLYDADDDGFIDEKEFLLVTGAFGISKEEAGAAFGKISEGGKVVKDLYSKLWNEFFTSENAGANGNLLFGKQL